MNWNDRFSSHQYVSVYWGHVANALKNAYPSFTVGRDPLERTNEIEVSS